MLVEGRSMLANHTVPGEALQRRRLSSGIQDCVYTVQIPCGGTGSYVSLGPGAYGEGPLWHEKGRKMTKDAKTTGDPSTETGAHAEERAPRWRLLRGTLLVLSVLIISLFCYSVIVQSIKQRKNWELSKIASFQKNMKQIGLAAKMYAMENERLYYPPAVHIDGMWVPDLKTIYPEFITDPTIFVNLFRHPDDATALKEALEAQPPDWDRAHRIVARHFFYTGYGVQDLSHVAVFHATERSDNRDENLVHNETVVYRIREGIERFYIPDWPSGPARAARLDSRLPLLIEQAFEADKPLPVGVSVLYMDNKVRRIELSEDPDTMAMLAALVLAQPPS